MKEILAILRHPIVWLHEFRENESGVAYFVSLIFIVFLMVLYLHLVSFSANVNRKIALQMAVDNAAHNGAVAQADILSRIAVVNQAIANTYVKNNRMHVDYLLQRYAFDVLRAFWYDSNEAAELEQNNSNACYFHKPFSSIYDSSYRSKQGNPDAITIDDILKQIPHESDVYVLAPDDGRYRSCHPYWGKGNESFNYNDRQYGVCSNGFWDQMYEGDGDETPTVIMHGKIATPQSIASEAGLSLNITSLYNFVKAQLDGNNAYWSLRDRIIEGSNNLVILNKELPHLVQLLDKYIYEAINASLDEIDMEKVQFFIQIGNSRYPYTRNGTLPESNFGNYNSLEYFQVPDEETFLAQRGAYQGDYAEGNWGSTSFWQKYREKEFFNRYLDLNNVPSIAFWHSWYFRWFCNAEGHFQFGLTNEEDSFPCIAALRQPESLRMGFYPNLSNSGDTGRRPCFSMFSDWLSTFGGYNFFLEAYRTAEDEEHLQKRVNIFNLNWQSYRNLANGPQIVHGRSDNPWASWEVEKGRELSCDYDRSAPAKPILMRETMFGKGGSILVGACQPRVALGNFGGKDISGKEKIYAIAASRAGVHIPGDEEGRYTTSWWKENEWNLFVDDWDAVMIPVAKAWHDSRDLAWEPNGNSSTDVLRAMKQAFGNPEDADFEGNGNEILH